MLTHILTVHEQLNNTIPTSHASSNTTHANLQIKYTHHTPRLHSSHSFERPAKWGVKITRRQQRQQKSAAKEMRHGGNDDSSDDEAERHRTDGQASAIATSSSAATPVPTTKGRQRRRSTLKTTGLFASAALHTRRQLYQPSLTSQRTTDYQKDDIANDDSNCDNMSRH
jgi:hypothetical protein